MDQLPVQLQWTLGLAHALLVFLRAWTFATLRATIGLAIRLWFLLN